MGNAGLAGHRPDDQVGDDRLPGFQCPSDEVEVRAVRQRLPERLAGVEERPARRVEQDHAVPVRVLVARENGAVVERGQVVCGQRIGRGQPFERREVGRRFAVNRQGERLGGRAEALLHALAPLRREPRGQRRAEDQHGQERNQNEGEEVPAQRHRGQAEGEPEGHVVSA